MPLCSNQTVAGLKLVSSVGFVIPNFGSNQTVAGLKHHKNAPNRARMTKFKSDRCGIETKQSYPLILEVIRSNQTVAGLKRVIVRPNVGTIASSNQTVAGLKRFQPLATVGGKSSSNQTVAGLKHIWCEGMGSAQSGFKSDRCGIETHKSGYIWLWFRLFKSDRCGIETRSFFHARSHQCRGSNQTVAGLKPGSRT